MPSFLSGPRYSGMEGGAVLSSKRLCALSLLLVSLAGCGSGPSATPDPLASPSSTEEPSPSPGVEPPFVIVEPADLVSDPPARPFDYAVVNPEPPRRVPNATRSFWVHDPASGDQHQITARLRVQTDHAAMWVEEWVWHDVRKMEEAALLFDSLVYPTVVSAFGSEWTPGVDNDTHIHILHADLGEGVLAYTSSADELPRDEYEYSNEAELILVQATGLEAGSPPYMALLAREFHRLVHQFVGVEHRGSGARDLGSGLELESEFSEQNVSCDQFICPLPKECLGTNHFGVLLFCFLESAGQRMVEHPLYQHDAGKYHGKGATQVQHKMQLCEIIHRGWLKPTLVVSNDESSVEGDTHCRSNSASPLPDEDRKQQGSYQ